MPDFVYLLQNRLSNDQRNALSRVSEAAREAGMTVFLVGGAVRDLISGSSVRDLDVAVQGNALKLKKSLLKAGAVLWGEHEPSRTLFLRFPVGVSVEVSSTRREEFPKPGKPVYHWDSILEDLRRRDFTANAMALSLNEHSYGLLMDPLNGVADIEARQLRLVSNYGFLEEPARLLRAVRLKTRLGWELEERTSTRYDNAKEEGVIESLSSYQRGYELQEIGHEEDGLRTLAAMEAEGWMNHLDSRWTAAKADIRGLEEMHKLRTQLQMQGVNPEFSTVSMQYLTAKLQQKDLAELKKMLVRPGFVEEWEALDNIAKEFAKQLTGKEAATPSATWKLFTSANPQAVLWLGLTSKSAPVQAKYTNFFTVWPEARQKVPHLLMQEMRITPELPGYREMLEQLFFGVIDGKLETDEQLRAFLEPYSPPAPPPPVTVRRSRGSRKAEPKARTIDVHDEDDDDEIDLDRENEDDDEDEDEPDDLGELPRQSARGKTAHSGQTSVKGQKQAKAEPEAKPLPAGKTAAKGAPVVPAKLASKTPEAAHKPAPAEPAKAAKAGKPVAPVKPIVSAKVDKKAPPAKAAVGRAPARPAVKAVPKGETTTKQAPAHAPVKHAPAKHAVGKHAAVKLKHAPAKHAPAKHVPTKHAPAPVRKSAVAQKKQPAGKKAKPAKKR